MDAEQLPKAADRGSAVGAKRWRTGANVKVYRRLSRKGETRQKPGQKATPSMAASLVRKAGFVLSTSGASASRGCFRVTDATAVKAQVRGR